VADILLLLILNALAIKGFYYATQFDGWESYHEWGDTSWNYGKDWKGALWWVRFYGVMLPEWMQKPLFSCNKCMASFHGSYVFIGYLYFNQISLEYLWCYPVYVLALVGVNLYVNE